MGWVRNKYPLPNTERQTLPSISLPRPHPTPSSIYKGSGAWGRLWWEERSFSVEGGHGHSVTSLLDKRW